MKNIIRWLFLNLFFLCGSNLNAQVVQDVAGKPLLQNKYAEIKGEIYFIDDWCPGYVKKTNGIKNEGYQLKYDQLEDVLIYRNKDLAYTFLDKIGEFGLITADGDHFTFRNGFKPTSRTSENSYFQVLYDGIFKFLKKDFKNVIEDREYNSATVTKKITSSILYFYVDINQNIVPVKRDLKTISVVLNADLMKLTDYTKQNKLDLKKEPDLIKFLSFVASLK